MARPDPDQVTQALHALRRGDSSALDEVLPLLYDELRAIAARQMSKERAGHTLQPTALLNEAWLRIHGEAEAGLENRAHFFAVASRAMRQVLVDHARRRGASKRGGDQRQVTLHDEIATDGRETTFDILDLHEALDRLADLDPELGHMIELRFFGGLTLDETADVIGVSRRKVANDWAFARAWLSRELTGDG